MTDEYLCTFHRLSPLDCAPTPPYFVREQWLAPTCLTVPNWDTYQKQARNKQICGLGKHSLLACPFYCSYLLPFPETWPPVPPFLFHVWGTFLRTIHYTGTLGCSSVFLPSVSSMPPYPHTLLQSLRPPRAPVWYRSIGARTLQKFTPPTLQRIILCRESTPWMTIVTIDKDTALKQTHLIWRKSPFHSDNTCPGLVWETSQRNEWF